MGFSPVPVLYSLTVRPNTMSSRPGTARLMEARVWVVGAETWSSISALKCVIKGRRGGLATGTGGAGLGYSRIIMWERTSSMLT